MIIRHRSPDKGWVKIDKKVMTLDMSNGAKVLYAYMSGLKNGSAYSDKYLCMALKMSQAMLTRRKAELKSSGLLIVEQIQPRVYVAYIGSTSKRANEVREGWSSEDGLMPGEDK